MHNDSYHLDSIHYLTQSLSPSCRWSASLCSNSPAFDRLRCACSGLDGESPLSLEKMNCSGCGHLGLKTLRLASSHSIVRCVCLIDRRGCSVFSGCSSCCFDCQERPCYCLTSQEVPLSPLNKGYQSHQYQAPTYHPVPLRPQSTSSQQLGFNHSLLSNFDYQLYNIILLIIPF